MPHMSSGGSEDFYSTDEVKVYNDEGNKDEEKRSSENLSEEKLGLVTESEEGKNASIQGNYAGSEKGSGNRVDDDKSVGASGQGQGPPGSMGFFLPPYGPYPNGGGKFGMVQPPYHGLVMYNDFASPPPAHMGIPPVHTDPKTGLPRPPMYAAYPPHGQFPHPLYGPDPMVPWPRPGGYPITTGAFSGSYPPSLAISRYGHPSLLPPGIPHPGMPHPGMLPGHKSEMGSAGMQDGHRLDGHDTPSRKETAAEKRKNYVKKPLNAFMLFMKEMRPKVIAECTLRESSAINQILGRKWHALDRAEQAKYYELARKEKDLHMQLYPGWSARDNYAMHQKKKKRKKSDGPPGLTSPESKAMAAECPDAKKCRARYGMEQQSQWCKPCRRKKKCIRYLREDGVSSEGEDYDDELSSRLSSQRSTCDTDSVHDLDLDSPGPRPAPPDSARLSYGQPHSPLSPLCPEEEEVDVTVDTTGKLDLSFASGSNLGASLSSNPGPPPLPGPSSSAASSASSSAAGSLSSGRIPPHLPPPPPAHPSASHHPHPHSHPHSHPHYHPHHPLLPPHHSSFPHLPPLPGLPIPLSLPLPFPLHMPPSMSMPALHAGGPGSAASPQAHLAHASPLRHSMDKVMTSTPIKNEHPLAMTMASPRLAAT